VESNTSKKRKKADLLASRVAFVNISTPLNLRGSEIWLTAFDVLVRAGLSVRLVNFDYDWRYP